MTPETIAQVDAWLAGRAPTALSRRWGIFVSSWWYERKKWPNDVHATEAAMCGVLLALVREAWPGWDVVVWSFDSEKPRVTISRLRYESRCFTASTLASAIAAALMAADQKGGES